MSKKKTTGFVAAAAGIALLMGGATFALWNDSDSVNGGTITAGNLEVAVGNVTWEDVSEPGNAVPISLNDFRIVPGDKIRGTFPIDVALEGNNMAAELSLHTGHASGGLENGLRDFEFEVRDANGTLSSSTNPHDPFVPVELAPGTSGLTAVVTMTFDPDTASDSRALAKSQVALEGAGVKLEQVR